MTPAAPLSRRTLALFAGPALALAGVGLPLTALLPTYYVSQVGLTLSAVGLAFMSVRLIDIGLDPVLGVLMDRTRSRLGRFRPWLLAGTPLMMLSVVWLFFPYPRAGPVYLATGLLIAYAGWSICVLAQNAWGAALSTRYHERSRIFNWWQGANLVGLLLILLAPFVAARFGLEGPQASMQVMGAVLLVLFPLTTLLAVIQVGEPEQDEAAPFVRLADWLALFRQDCVRRILFVDLVLGLGFGIQATLFLFYFRAAKGFAEGPSNTLLLIYFLSALVGGPLWTVLARRIDKHRALTVSCLGYLVGLAGMGLIPAGQWAWAGPAAVLAGLPYSAPSLLSRSMMADAGDEVLLDTQVDRNGLLFALLNSTTKVGVALAVGTTFIGLDMAGFKAGSAHNGPGALLGLALLFLAAPALLNLMAALALIGYPLTSVRHAQIRAALADPDAV